MTRRRRWHSGRAPQQNSGWDGDNRWEPYPESSAPQNVPTMGPRRAGWVTDAATVAGRALRAVVGGIRARADDVMNVGQDTPGRDAAGMGNLGAILNSLNWDGIRAEIDQEARGRILMVGGPGTGKTALLSWLKGLATVPGRVIDASGTSREDYGLFASSSVDALDPQLGPENEPPMWLRDAQMADLIVWLLDASLGVRPWEHDGICRIRSLGKPLVIALNIRVGDAQLTSAEAQRQLASPVIPIRANDGWNVIDALLPRMTQACDRLNTALGREVPAWRSQAAKRVIARSATLSGMVGAEPVPLLDIPAQVVIQMRALLRIAAIYGEAQDDRFSRELIATLAGGAGIRIASQQIAKAIPVAGWLCSGAFAALGTWLMGQSARHYFAHGRRIDIPLPRLVWIHRKGGPEAEEEDTDE